MIYVRVSARQIALVAMRRSLANPRRAKIGAMRGPIAPTVKAARQPSIMADAARTILTQPVDAASGRFFIDEDVLRSAGVNDLSGYRVDPDLDDDKLLPDFFLD